MDERPRLVELLNHPFLCEAELCTNEDAGSGAKVQWVKSETLVKVNQAVCCRASERQSPERLFFLTSNTLIPHSYAPP